MITEPDPEQIADPSAIASPAAAVLASASAAPPRAAVELAQTSTILAASELDTYEESKHRQILGFRRWLVPGVFALTLAWLIFVAAIVRIEERRHPLSDAVLIALLGTATANVLGLLVIVLKSLFPVELDRDNE